jgi:hypothetical protein
MGRPRFSIAGLMVLVAVLAVDWAVMRNANAVCQRVSRHGLSLCYSWVPDRGHSPKDEPVYADYVSVLGSDRISAGLGLLAWGITPMVSLLGLGCVMFSGISRYKAGAPPFFSGSWLAVRPCYSAISAAASWQPKGLTATPVRQPTSCSTCQLRSSVG